MKTETGLTIAFVLGMLFKIMHWPGGGVIIVLSLSTLSMIYSFGSAYFFSDKSIEQSRLLLSIFSGILLAVAPVAVLFKVQYWPGAHSMLTVASIVAPLVLGATLYFRSGASENLTTYFRNMTLRSAVISAVCIVLLFLNTETMLKIQYWNDPELARLKALHYTMPENEDYKKQHDAYIQQLDSLQEQEM